MEEKGPDYANGKICYVIIPSRDTEASASFFERTVNWRIRRDNHGSLSFDDGVGQVSGMWVTGLKPHRDSDLRIHIMVADIAATVEKIKAAGEPSFRILIRMHQRSQPNSPILTIIFGGFIRNELWPASS